MKQYFVAQIDIHDQSLYDRYLERVDEVFDQFRGKYLVVDDAPVVLEGKWNYSRFVIIEFPDEAELKRWYHSPQYQEILKYRLEGARCDTLSVREVEE